MAMDYLSQEDLVEPTPSIHDLFVYYNDLYFNGALGGVSVEWSSARMTMCAGTCENAAGGALIKLSKPILSLRPIRDLKSTLLHEMIHAFNMVHGIKDDDPTGHGTHFKKMMQSINVFDGVDHQRPPQGYGISVYHSMFQEVDHYRTHHWECNRCGNLVKRSMNRPPQEADCIGRAVSAAACTDVRCRFHMHVKHCGGTFIKIKEPEGYAKKGSKKTLKGEGSEGERGGGKKKFPGVPHRPITEFFSRMEQPKNEQARKGQEEEDISTIPALTAVLQGGQKGRASATHLPRQQQQQQQKPLDAEGRRTMLEAAALRRVHASSRYIQQQQQQPENVEFPTDIDAITNVEAHCSSVDGQEGSPAGGKRRRVIVDLTIEEAEERKEENIVESGSGGWHAACPVCGLKVTAKNAEEGNVLLNTHLDRCLLG